MYSKLESLRGVAAVLVVLYHSPWTWGERRLAWFDHGYLLVDFFFILSGFVMCHAYHAKIIQGMKFRDYFALRISRLYPLHLAMLVCWTPYVLLKQGFAAQTGESNEALAASNLSSFLSNLLLIQAWGLHDSLSWNGPSWSISAELFAYLVFFVTTVTIDRRGRWWVPLGLSIAGYSWLLAKHGSDFDYTYDYGCVRCLAGFNLGMVVYRICPALRLSFASQSWLELATAVAAIVGIASASATSGIVGTMLSFALLVGVFSLPTDGVVGQLLKWPPMPLLGRWSYSIYLVHALVIAVASNTVSRLLPRDLIAPSPVTAIIANVLLLAVVIAISRWTFERIERPARDWMKDRIRRPAKVNSAPVVTKPVVTPVMPA